MFRGNSFAGKTLEFPEILGKFLSLFLPLGFFGLAAHVEEPLRLPPFDVKVTVETSLSLF